MKSYTLAILLALTTQNAWAAPSSSRELTGSKIRNGSGLLTLPTSTDTLMGRATTDTVTNKSISGATNTITNVSGANVVNTPSGNLAATTAQAALNELQGDINTINSTFLHYAILSCAAASAITSQNGTWISSIGNRSTGTCTVGFTGGTFGSTPACVANLIDQTGAGETAVPSSISSSGFTLAARRIQAGSSAANNADYVVHLICMGVP